MRAWLVLLTAAACERAEPRSGPPVPCTPVVEAPDAAAPPPVLDKSPRGKRRELEQMLQRGPVEITIDAAAPGVVVPPRYADEHALVLRFGRDLTPPVPDLVVDDAGVHATLTFAGAPFATTAPWDSMRAFRLELFVDVAWEDERPREDGPAPRPRDGGRAP